MLAGALGSKGSVFWVLIFGTTSGSRCCVLFSSKLNAKPRSRNIRGASIVTYTILFLGFFTILV